MASSSYYAGAIAVRPQRTTGQNAGVFEGVVDPGWLVGAVPQGGYVLSLVIESCTQHQRRTESHHVDPIHVTAHFLRSSSIGPFQVRVRTIRTGKGFSNILGELVQNDLVTISAHLIFGVLGSPDRDVHPHPRTTLVPGMPHARRVPLHLHPSVAAVSPITRPWTFAPRLRFAEDPVLLARNNSSGPNAAVGTKEEVGGGGAEWGAWFELREEGEVLSTPMMAFLADIFKNLPELVAKEERDGMGLMWFPTMVMTLEFKAPIPPPSSPDHSRRTVGIYSRGTFMNDPNGRHEAYVEVWTAPSNIGEGKEDEGWRDKQMCLVTSTQMALCIPIEVNQRKSKL